LKALNALTNLSAHIPRLIHAIVYSFPQARGILTCAEHINIVGEFSIAAEEVLKLALEVVLKFLESRVIAIAGAATPGF
jgi:hypothetical protein